MTLPDFEELAARYRIEPDETLLAALATGADGYSPEAWRAISEEVTRRSLTLSEPVPAPAPPEASSPERDVPLPRWLSASLLGLAGLFLLVQIIHLLAYYGVIDTRGVYLGTTSTLAFGITAWTATRFVRVGPHARAARTIGLLAFALTAAAIIARP